ncbi:hypothetical protein [Azospirillum argentinense]|uniref:hypothetical protein n=1 Tax=Azospirillum argentinense TaxID=2970906 RepID=UPI0032DF72D9
MQTIESIRAILARVTYLDWTVEAHMDGARPYLQVVCETGACNTTGVATRWTGRKWFLSFHMTTSEIVQTAFKAVLGAVEHEVRETFKYRDAAVYGPHFDVELLVDLARMGDRALDARSAA